MNTLDPRLFPTPLALYFGTTYRSDCCGNGCGVTFYPFASMVWRHWYFRHGPGRPWWEKISPPAAYTWDRLDG